MCAKALATGDLLFATAGSRSGSGVGGRHEDYHAVSADPNTKTMRAMDRVAVMRRVWAGEKLTGSAARRSRSAARRPATTGRHHRAQDGRAAPRPWADRLAGHLHGPRHRQGEGAVRRRARILVRSRQTRATPGDVVLVRTGRAQRRAGSGAPPPVALHELDTRPVRRGHRIHRRLGRHQRTTIRLLRAFRAIQRHPPHPTSSGLGQVHRAAEGPSKFNDRTPSAPQFEIYFQDSTGALPNAMSPRTSTRAQHAPSPSVWSYVAGEPVTNAPGSQRDRVRELGTDSRGCWSAPPNAIYP